MKLLRNTILPIIIAGLWISISEFFRNEILFKDLWIEHYNSLGLSFPSKTINGIVWGIWSFLFAAVIYLISEKFSLTMTILISWLTGFVLMWLVIGNLEVLPDQLLIGAAPLSLIEVIIASLIIKKLSKQKPI